MDYYLCDNWKLNFPVPAICLYDICIAWAVGLNCSWAHKYFNVMLQVTEQRRKEWNDMHSYFQTEDRCLMTSMRLRLDDINVKDPEERCGRCSNCRDEPIASTNINKQLANEAIEYIRKSEKSFICKTDAPRHFSFRLSNIMLEVNTCEKALNFAHFHHPVNLWWDYFVTYMTLSMKVTTLHGRSSTRPHRQRRQNNSHSTPYRSRHCKTL